MVAIGSVTFIVATMGINIVANFVSPAYDIANLYPEKINFRLGGLITSILSVLVCPWLFVSSPQAITLFVSIFGAVLGPLFGIIIADYYLVKRQAVAVDDLYSMSPAGLATSTTAAGTATPSSRWRRPASLSIGLALAGRLRRHHQCRRLGLVDRRRSRRLASTMRCRATRARSAVALRPAAQ